VLLGFFVRNRLSVEYLFLGTQEQFKSTPQPQDLPRQASGSGFRCRCCVRLILDSEAPNTREGEVESTPLNTNASEAIGKVPPRLGNSFVAEYLQNVLLRTRIRTPIDGPAKVVRCAARPGRRKQFSREQWILQENTAKGVDQKSTDHKRLFLINKRTIFKKSHHRPQSRYELLVGALDSV